MEPQLYSSLPKAKFWDLSSMDWMLILVPNGLKALKVILPLSITTVFQHTKSVKEQVP